MEFEKDVIDMYLDGVPVTEIAKRYGLSREVIYRKLRRYPYWQDILKEKNHWINQSFKLSHDKIKSLPEKEYKRFIKKQIIKSVESGNEELVLSEEDYKKFGKKLVDEINKELKKGNLKLSVGKLSKGFILKDDKKEKNCTFEIIFTKLREQIETEVAKKLFG